MARKRRLNSMSARLRIVLLVFLPLFLITLIVCNTVIDYTRNQASQYLENTLDLYVKDIDKTITNISRRMRMLLLGTAHESIQAASHIDTIENSENEALVNYSISQLKQVFNEFTQEYGESKNFFIYLSEPEKYIRCTDGHFSQRDYRQYEQRIVEMIRADQAQGIFTVQSWRDFSVDSDNSALVKMYRKGNVYLGCWIQTDDLVEPLSAMNFGKDGFVVVCDKQNRVLTGQKAIDAQNLDLHKLSDGSYRLQGQMLPNRLIITRAFSSVPYQVWLFISNYGTFERLLYIQMLLVFLAIAMLGCMLIAVYVLQRGILKPVRSFTRSLQQIEAGYGNIESLSHSELQELEKANAEFAKLLSEVERLKVAVYEQGIEKQAIQMDFLKLQIKPHFYLNCLNFIYNMIDLGEYENAKKMSRIASDYLRYLFKKGDHFSTLGEEMDHVRDYMEIQKMRYDTAVSFSMSLDEQAKGIHVPPLVVQTFVENSVKHALTLENEVCIQVSACMKNIDGQPPCVELIIRDTGSGFDPDVLSCLARGGNVRGKDGSGVGIDNCLKRLYYYYGSQSSIRFYNHPEGGAVVQIHLPVAMRKEGASQ